MNKLYLYTVKYYTAVKILKTTFLHNIHEYQKCDFE